MSARRWSRAAWAIGLVAALAGAAEWGARLNVDGGERDLPVYAAGDAGGLRYTLRPGWTGRYWNGQQAVDVHIGPDGLRRTVGAPADAARTLHLVGDSQTFGWGLPDEATIASRLQALLGPGVRVVNHGVPGYGPREYAQVVAALPAGDRVVVLLTEQNDLWDLYGGNAPREVRCGRLISGGGLLGRLPCPAMSSRLLQGAAAALFDVAAAPLPIQRNPYARAADAVLSNRLDAIVARWQARGGVQLAVVPWELDADPRRRVMYPAIAAGLAEHTLPGACGRDSGFRGRPELFLRGDTHLSDPGAALMAQCLATMLRREESSVALRPAAGRAG